VAPAVGTTVVGAGVTAVALAGIRRWNALALVTTVCTMALLGLVEWRLAARELPLAQGLGAPDMLLRDVAAFVGFVAVFALRAPDFTAQLRTRRSLAACVACLVLPMTLAALVGVGVHLGTGTLDVVALLAGTGSLAVGNLLIAVGVVAPTLAALHSGRLAGQGLLPVGPRGATALVVAPGAVLALTRFDLHMQPWLAVLAAALPALVVPMAVEGTRRRRGGLARRIPLWTWVPGSGAALALLPVLPGWPSPPRPRPPGCCAPRRGPRPRPAPGAPSRGSRGPPPGSPCQLGRNGHVSSTGCPLNPRARVWSAAHDVAVAAGEQAAQQLGDGEQEQEDEGGRPAAGAVLRNRRRTVRRLPAGTRRSGSWPTAAP
jgi:hypothetical protein